MSTRFRIRFLDGGEATVDSLEAFCDLVQSGEITVDDLVHDALTGEWVPAAAHPMYKLALDPLVATGETWATESRAADEADEPDEAETADSFFDLAPPMPESIGEETDADFIRQMEVERSEDPDQSWMVTGLEPMGDTIDLGVEPVPQRQWQVDEPAVQPIRRSRPYRSALRPAPVRQRRTLHVSLTLILVLGSAGVAGGVGLAWPEVNAFVTGIGSTSEASSSGAALSEERLRRDASEAFLGKVAGLGESLGVGAVPGAWLEGRYLANAGAFPEVGSYWARYRDYVEAARARDEDLYRAAYLESLERRRVRGSERTRRLADALAEFSGHRYEREAAYERAAALAEAALELHELSAADAGRISYEPARADGASADPVIEAAGRDAEIQADLDAALDRVLAALHGDGVTTTVGPGREGLAGWLVEMLRTPAISR